jgi:hypothetical protein
MKSKTWLAQKSGTSHHGWENHRNKWDIFQQAMFDYQRVTENVRGNPGFCHAILQISLSLHATISGI